MEHPAEGSEMYWPIITQKDCDAPGRIGITIMFGVRGIYGILSLVLYGVNIVAMRKSKISKTFYVLYSTCALMVFLAFFDNWVIQFLDTGQFCDTIYRLFSEQNWWITVVRLIKYYCPIAILEFHFVISLNRMMTVVFPTKLKNWDPHIFKIILVLIIIPWCFVWFVIPCKGFIINDPVGGLGMEFGKSDSGIFCRWSPLGVSVIVSVFFGTLTFVNTTLTLVVLKKKSVSVNDFGMIYFEIMLAVATFIFASMQAASLILRDLRDYEQLEWNVESVRFYVLDLLILPQAWTLPLFSMTVRTSVKRLLLCSKNATPSVSSFLHQSTGHSRRQTASK